MDEFATEMRLRLEAFTANHSAWLDTTVAGMKARFLAVPSGEPVRILWFGLSALDFGAVQQRFAAAGLTVVQGPPGVIRMLNTPDSPGSPVHDPEEYPDFCAPSPKRPRVVLEHRPAAGAETQVLTALPRPF